MLKQSITSLFSPHLSNNSRNKLAIKNGLIDMTLGRYQLRQKSDLTGDKMRLPIGYDDFGKIVDNNIHYKY